MTTYSSIIQRARTILQDSDSSSYRWTDAELLSYGSEGYNEFARRTGFLRGYVSVSITTATSGSITFANSTGANGGLNKADIHRVYKASWDSVPIYPVSIDWLENNFPKWTNNDWASQSGTPEYYTQESTGPMGLRLVPYNSAAGTLSVYYYKIPEYVSSSASTLDIPTAYDNAVLYWMLARAFTREIDSPGGNDYRGYANHWMKEFERVVADAANESSAGFALDQSLVIPNMHS